MKKGHEWTSTTKAAVTPSLKGLTWAAGFLEGEGCFYWRNTEMIAAGQVQKEPLLWLQQMFGGNIALKKNGKNAIWSWLVCGSRARGIMLTLFPLMSTRRKEQITTAFRKIRISRQADGIPIGEGDNHGR